MEVDTLWICSPDPSSTEEDTEMHQYVVEEIIIEEDGNEGSGSWSLEETWASTSANVSSPCMSSESIETTDSTPDSPLVLSQHDCSSPTYVLPHENLTEEEDGILDESFELMEDLLSMKDNRSSSLKNSDDGETLAEKAQALLDHLDDYIKQEPFSDWLEEKTELPLFEELGNYVNCQRSSMGLNILPPAVSVQPRSVPLQTPHIGQIAPSMGHMVPGMTLLNTAQIPLSAQIPPQLSTPPPQNLDLPSSPQQVPSSPSPPLTPALIREFESVLNQTLTPPHTPPTILNLVNSQEESVKSNNLEEDIDTLINSQFASFYEEKVCDKISDWVPASTQDSPEANDWSSISTHEEKNPTEDSDSTYPSSSESDPEWSPSPSRSVSGRNKRAVSSTDERKIRKKEQNKNAATRYRLKKKAEQAGIVDEEFTLVEKNNSLKEKATELQREVKYLKSLMRDICKAKGLIS